MAREQAQSDNHQEQTESLSRELLGYENGVTARVEIEMDPGRTTESGDN